jgi:lysophospholipid acyltransferase (LPLAT)-like uncharacterized protein
MKFLALKKIFLPAFFYHGISFVDFSYRYEKINEPLNIEGAKIFATWHGRMVCFLQFAPREKTNLLISRSNDGNFITQATEKLGFKVIRGSASRGGMAAIKGMLQALEKGENVAFTVDGPRGPIYQVKNGIIKLAQASGAPIIPVIPVTKYRVLFPFWDKFYGPFFFSKLSCTYGEPFYVDKDIDEDEIELLRQNLNKQMIDLTIKAEKTANTYSKALGLPE